MRPATRRFEERARGAEARARAKRDVPPAAREKDESERWEADARFRTMADTAPVLLWMAGTDGSCDFFNQGWLDFTGKTMEQERGTGWAEGVHPEDLQGCLQTYMDAFVERRPFSMEYRLLRHDGEYRWIYDQGTPRFDEDGAFAGFIGSCVDVTAQREARDATARLNRELESRVRERTALARERETLLREAHHRIKNGLQLISSLLSIQGRKLGEPTERALEACRSRVDAIAAIHDHLHHFESYETMALSGHLATLIDNVVQASGSAAGVRVERRLNDSISVSVKRAVPCVLLVHELLVNTLEHAFEEGRAGRLRVTCGRDPAGKVSVVVEDDGIGLPEDYADPERGSLGWVLIHDFARQLRAELKVTRHPGTRVEIRFEDEGAEGAPREET